MDSPVVISKLNLAGDKRVDLTAHGGAEKAACAYPEAESFPLLAKNPLLERRPPGSSHTLVLALVIAKPTLATESAFNKDGKQWAMRLPSPLYSRVA